ncbi:MAG: HU family DNA-binding protein [Flavobacteriales bacterium]|nr:HU family DNA-binding protein [Flavobacteriales bacterium]
MNKSELVAAMAAKTGESKASQERSLEAMLEAVTEALASGDDLRLIGFGRLYVQEYAARDYRNPRTGTIIKSDGKKKKKVRFKGGSSLTNKVN